MLYEMARRYDEWPGEDYEGSSARGAMKGWHKHGVCAGTLWRAPKKVDRALTAGRAADALRRPLGAYFRVNHKDLVAMHAAIAEVGILYATSNVHVGWERPGKDGRIDYSDDMLGGHAFAIVGYDDRGFWIQNSWGPRWGRSGYGHVSYDDWLENGTDVWVARLGVPVVLETAGAAATAVSTVAKASDVAAQADLRQHIVSIGNDGRLRSSGPYGTTAHDLDALFDHHLPAVLGGWKNPRILLYAHGGLVSEESAVQHVADARTTLIDHEVYPLAFVWKTDYWSTLRNVLDDALSRRKPEGVLDKAKDFMLDRLDDALEPLARTLSGKLEWDEMKENGIAATTSGSGGARMTLDRLARLRKKVPNLEVHVAGHSAGSIFMAPIVSRLATSGKIGAGPMKGKAGMGIPIESCTLWAPACTIELFKQTYLPVIRPRGIGRFSLFTVTDKAERDDNCAKIYHKSLLYLVSNAFEAWMHVPLFRDGVPLLGMNKFVEDDQAVKSIFKKPHRHVLAPNAVTDPMGQSGATSHGGFDDDPATLRSTLAIILNGKPGPARFAMRRSASGTRALRGGIDLAIR